MFYLPCPPCSLPRLSVKNMDIKLEVVFGLETVLGCSPTAVSLSGRLRRLVVISRQPRPSSCTPDSSPVRGAPFSPRACVVRGSEVHSGYRLITNPAFPGLPASRDTPSSPYPPTRASSAGSRTATRCTPSSGTTERKRRSFSTSSIASCCGYVMRPPNPVLECLDITCKLGNLYKAALLVLLCMYITEKSIWENSLLKKFS